MAKRAVIFGSLIAKVIESHTEEIEEGLTGLKDPAQIFRQ